MHILNVITEVLGKVYKGGYGVKQKTVDIVYNR